MIQGGAQSNHNQSQADTYHWDMEDMSETPPETDDRSHTGGRCGGGGGGGESQQHNPVCSTASGTEIYKITFHWETCAWSESKHFGRGI